MRAHHIVYNSDKNPHTTRDTEALWALMPALLDAGVRPGDSFFASAAHTLYLPRIEPHLSFRHLEARLATLRAAPAERRDNALIKKLARLQKNYAALDRRCPESWRFQSGYQEAVSVGDLLVLTTRPPMEERRHGAKETARPPRNVTVKAVIPSWTDLEDCVMSACAEVFAQIKRDEVGLRVLPKSAAEFAGVEFRQYGAAGEQACAITPDGEEQDFTLGYFAVLPLPAPAARLVLAFGMSGMATLAWSRSLALNWHEWGLDVKEDCIVVAKLWPSSRERPAMRLSEMDWDVELIANLRKTAQGWEPVSES